MTKVEERQVVDKQADFKLIYETVAKAKYFNFETDELVDDDCEGFESKRWCLWYEDIDEQERLDSFESLSEDNAVAYLSYARKWLKTNDFVLGENEPLSFEKWLINKDIQTAMQRTIPKEG